MRCESKDRRTKDCLGFGVRGSVFKVKKNEIGNSKLEKVGSAQLQLAAVVQGSMLKVQGSRKSFVYFLSSILYVYFLYSIFYGLDSLLIVLLH